MLQATRKCSIDSPSSTKPIRLRSNRLVLEPALVFLNELHRLTQNTDLANKPKGSKQTNSKGIGLTLSPVPGSTRSRMACCPPYAMRLVLFFLLVAASHLASGQRHFNAWLSTCPHLVGPTGSTKMLTLALNQSRGLVTGAPAFSWDMMVDVGDWTASQAPPDHEDGESLALFLKKSFDQDRGRFFTVSGNHDGDQKGWLPGQFTQSYVNPLGVDAYSGSSDFKASQRPDSPDFKQLLTYPGTRWDRYLIRSGNVIWIMLGDRNEFDTLAETRGDRSGIYQAGRGSAAGMPRGGYPSGSVTLDTFEWWKGVIENPDFANDILITTHHLLPRNTTVTTDDGDPGNYHGSSGSVGPNGKIGGQLYWIREYDESGAEIFQYAQTRPFLDYLQDHPGAIAVWIGGHSHIGSPEEVINGRGIYVRKYEVTFLSVGALTDSHGGRNNQMTRLLSFEEGSSEAVVNVYIHHSTDGHSVGWFEPASKRVPLGKEFDCPHSSTDLPSPVAGDGLVMVPDAPKDPLTPRYFWDLDEDRNYDFNNYTHVVGADGSPYGEYQAMGNPSYSMDSMLRTGRSLDLRGTAGRVHFSGPYQPKMNWPDMTMSCWIKTASTSVQEVVSFSSANTVGKFRFWYDGSAWSFEVAENKLMRSARWETEKLNDGRKWHHIVGIADSKDKRIQLYVNGELKAEANWRAPRMKDAGNDCLVIGASGDPVGINSEITWSHPFDGFIDELMFFDSVMDPNALRSIGTLR